MKLQHACVYTFGAKIPLVSLLVEMAAFRTKLPSFLRGNQELEDSDSLSDQSYPEGQIVTEHHNEDGVEHDINEGEGSEDDVVVDPEDFGISQALKKQRNSQKKCFNFFRLVGFLRLLALMLFVRAKRISMNLFVGANFVVRKNNVQKPCAGYQSHGLGPH